MSVIQRVRTSFTGAGVTGGGVCTQFFDNVSNEATTRALVGNFWRNMDDSIVNSVTWTVEPQVDFVEDTTGLIVSQGSDPTAQTGSGALTGQGAALATQGLITWLTGQFIDGNQVIGKTYIPGVPSGLISAGGPNLTYRNNLASAAAVMVTAGRLRVFSPTHLVSHQVTSARPSAQFAVLRSRRD